MVGPAQLANDTVLVPVLGSFDKGYGGKLETDPDWPTEEM